jgi:Skp family chaperone for outer membrane proteins
MAESVVLYDFSVVYAPADEAWANRLATALRERRQSLPDGLDQIDPSTARNLVALWSAHARTAPNVSAAIHRFNESRLASPGARRLIFVLLSLDRPDYEEVEVIDDLANTTAGPESVSNELWTDVVNVIVQPEPLKPRNRGRNRRPGGTPTQSAAQTSSDDPLRIENVGQRYRLFPSTHDIITHAPELSGKSINNITTALLLAAICNRGTVTPTPTWAPAWLRSRWGDDGNRRLIDLAKLNAERGQADDRPPVPVLTAGSDAILASAQQIAQRTSSSDEIRVRHLLGALLKDPRGPSESTALSAISELGHDIVKLRESFFDFVREADDDDDAWGEILLGAKEDSRILPGFDADSDTGDDQLDIKPDVMAFAGLIAARTLKPPLSIGLFGEWGSGKTFFMRMLARQVASLAQHGRDEWYRNRTRQREQPYYRRIVQIEFNAWHYADGNLWASLVQHIFDNLRIDDKRRASQDLQEPILQKLNVEKAAEAQARREHEAAKSQRDAAVQAVSDARKEFEIKAEELAQMSGKNVLADAPTEDVANAFAPLLAELGINAAITKGVELRATLAEAKTMLGRGQAAFAPLLTSRDRGRRSLFLGMALIAGPAAALAADAIPRWLGAQGVSTVTAMATGAASLLASLTAWLRHQLAWVGDRLKQIEEVQRKFDQSVERAQSDNRKAIREAEERLRLLEADYIAAQRKEEEATRRTLEAEAKLTEATVSRLLTTFIEERANSNDYRKHLGMLALVRNDFEKLSDLIAEENDALDGISNDGTDPFPTIEHEARDEEKRINRIVLYIDDLDRCPPAKVVEVLQAVHLLLAFPLFVVVVGVDARWVLRSIEARYRELLKSDGNAPDQGRVNEFKELFGYASAHDYVEKIFQVPFWLKPMSPESSRRLVRDLLKASVVDDAATSDTATGESRPAVKGSMMTPPAAGTANGASVGQSSSQSPDPLRSDAAMTNMEGGIGEETRTPPDLTPAGLEITRAEFDSISDLAPLLGRSPRTLKRFVNVYRLIRVGLSPWERELFLSDAHGLPDYRSVLLLLAIDTGAPKVATPFFNTIRELMSSIPLQPPREKKGRATAPRGGLSALLDRLNEDAEINTLEEWHRVGGWLHARLQNQTLPDDVSRVARWIPRVSRFSFHTGRLG